MSLCIMFSALLLVGQPDRSEEISESSADQRLVFAQQAASIYRFRLSKSTKKVKLSLKPLLRWNNHVVREDDGILFLWTEQNKGRPVAAAQFFLADRHWHHEFQSLSPGPFDADQSDGKWSWAPKQAGVRWQNADDGSPPADSAVQRLRQMKSLVGRFTAAVDQHDEFESPEQLRLLTTPLYRYAADEEDVVDGAMFAFVQGTNPEILVLVEAQPAAPSRTVWRYAFARMSCFALRVDRDGQTVWSERRAAVPTPDATGPYFIRWKAQPDRSAEVVVRSEAKEGQK